MQEKLANLTYIPWLTMMIIDPNIQYGLFKAHAFVKFVSPSTPFV